MQFAAYIAVSFITFFHDHLVPFFFIIVCMIVWFVCFLFNFVNYVYYCYVYLF